LWLIGVTLFLPTVRACERVVSPATLIHDDALTFAPMLAPFLCAELLAILLLLPLLRRVEPSRRWWLAALATVLPVFASPGLFLYGSFRHLPVRLEDQLFGGGALVAVVLAVAVLVIGAGKTGWPRLMSSVAAFTILTLPLTICFVHDLIEEHLRHVYIGGVTFVSAMLALTLLTASCLRAITRA
jgi:hypothetical protein